MSALSHAQLVERARRRLAREQRLRRSARFRRVVGRFANDGLLLVNYDVPRHVESLRVEDVLWAGQLEPRLLELLPALIIKRPSMFRGLSELPDDLCTCVSALRRDKEPPDFRGIPGQSVRRWLKRVGRRGKVPALLKSFRFTPEDQRLLAHLAAELSVSETEVIRRALRALVV